MEHTDIFNQQALLEAETQIILDMDNLIKKHGGTSVRLSEDSFQVSFPTQEQEDAFFTDALGKKGQ